MVRPIVFDTPPSISERIPVNTGLAVVENQYFLAERVVRLANSFLNAVVETFLALARQSWGDNDTVRI